MKIESWSDELWFNVWNTIRSILDSREQFSAHSELSFTSPQDLQSYTLIHSDTHICLYMPLYRFSLCHPSSVIISSLTQYACCCTFVHSLLTMFYIHMEIELGANGDFVTIYWLADSVCLYSLHMVCILWSFRPCNLKNEEESCVYCFKNDFPISLLHWWKG